MATTQVYFEGDVYTGLPLAPKELQTLNKHLDYISHGNGFLAELFRTEHDNLVSGLQVAKAELGGQQFTGMYAGDAEIGIQLIRPSHVLRSTATTETVVNDWTITFSAGTQYWIGYSTTFSTAINVDKRLCVIPLGVWFTGGSSPVVEEIYVQLGGTAYPVNVVRHAWQADNYNRIRAARIRPMIWKPKSRPLVQLRALSAQTQEFVLVGVTFGLGDLLRTLAPSGSPQT